MSESDRIPTAYVEAVLQRIRLINQGYADVGQGGCKDELIIQLVQWASISGGHAIMKTILDELDSGLDQYATYDGTGPVAPHLAKPRG
jgi:hypothetical protein